MTEKILLVGDIGGTKTRLRLLKTLPPQPKDPLPALEILQEETFVSQQFPDLVPIVQAFLGANVTPFHPTQACFGIAGPVIDNRCVLTNLNWQLTGDRLADALALEAVTLINDFAAVGYGILALKPEDWQTLQAAERQPTAPIAVIGAGTGLGFGFLIPHSNGQYQVFNSEGGHREFAPTSQDERRIQAWLKEAEQIPRVSTERVVSGLGIVNLYQCLRQQYPQLESAAMEQRFHQWQASQSSDRAQHHDPSVDIAVHITQAALDQSDQLCEKVMALFVNAYGSIAGDFALTLLPYGGIYIAGGIAPKILPLLERYGFLAAFLNKGRMQTLLQQMPVQVITQTSVGLMGAAVRANQL